jgi:hypothetical protein
MPRVWDGFLGTGTTFSSTLYPSYPHIYGPVTFIPVVGFSDAEVVLPVVPEVIYLTTYFSSL